MKKFLTVNFLILGLISTSFAKAREIDLAKVSPSTDGYCTTNVLRMASAKPLVAANTSEKAFMELATYRAKQIYLSTTLTYVEGAKEGDLKVDVKYQTIEKFNGPKAKAAIIGVDQGGDEDLVEFYFVSDRHGNPKLLMAFHNEQSAEAFWACE